LNKDTWGGAYNGEEKPDGIGRDDSLQCCLPGETARRNSRQARAKEGGEKDAETFQGWMQSLVNDHFGKQEIRMLWGSFGDTDISDPTIRKDYYDDKTWAGLHQLKKQVDAGDLFHTQFTVQLP
jgi:hypothetical protein